MHNAGIKWFVVVWPTVLTSCTAEIPALDDKAILVEYNVLDGPAKKEGRNHSTGVMGQLKNSLKIRNLVIKVNVLIL